MLAGPMIIESWREDCHQPAALRCSLRGSQSTLKDSAPHVSIKTRKVLSFLKV